MRTLVGGAVSLLANTGIQSGFGFAFAVLAAHEFRAGTVGRDLTVISVGRALSGFSQLNTGPLLYRTLAVVDRPAHLLLRVYSWTVTLAVVLSTAVLLIGSRYSGSLRDVTDEPLVAVAFVAFVASWTVYALQDNALIALHHARITPYESAVFGVLTLGLLVVFHAADVSFPVFWAFVLPLPLLVLSVNAYLVLVGIPRDMGSGVPRRPFALRLEASVLSGDVVVSLLNELERALLPLMVVQRLGNEEAAYFAAAYAISGAIRVGVASVSVPFGVELARRPHDRRELVGQSFRWIMRFAVPACLVAAAASPVMLAVFGADYRRAATWLLVLLSVSAGAGAVNALAVNVARVDRRIRIVLGLAAMHTAIVLVLAVLFLDDHGLVVVGIGYTVSELLAVVASVWYLRRPGPRSSLAA